MVVIIYPNMVAVLYRVNANGDQPSEATCGDAYHVRETIDRWCRENPDVKVLGILP